ncbi:MAG: glycosyltransferase [Clostridia bacterium]
MEEIVLSVIIPVYNTEKYLSKCLDSVILASKNLAKKVQIIVVNDGSEGNCDELINDYINKNPNCITYIKQENKGLGGARNTGILNANGKYISCIDPDDYIDENMYKNMYKKLVDEKSDICVCDFETISNDNKTSYRVEAKNISITDNKFGTFDTTIMPSACNKIIRKKLFDNIKFPEKLRYEDLATIPILMIKANKISYIDDMYYKYYLSNNSIMRSEFSNKNLQLIDSLSLVISRINNLEISNDEKNKYKYMIFTRRFYEDILEPISMLEKKNKKEILKEFSNKIAIIIDEMKNNIYFKKNIKKSGMLKYIMNLRLFKALKEENINWLEKYLVKNRYYRYISEKYTNVILGK